MTWYSRRPRLVSLIVGFVLATGAAASAWAAPFAPTSAPPGTWHQIASCPLPHAGHSAVYDPVNDQMIVFGGWTYMDYGPHSNDTWVLNLSDPPTWSLLEVLGSRPPERSDHLAIFDPPRNRMLVYGPGAGGLWELDLSGTPAWHQLSPTGPTPFGYVRGGAIYDAARGRMIVVGDGVWALPLAGALVWSQIVPSGSGVQGPAVYDPNGDRVIVGTKQLPLSGPLVWQSLAPSGAPPTVGNGSVAYDPIQDRVLWFGGSSFSCDPGPWCTTTLSPECTALRVNGPAQWQPLQSGPYSNGQTAIYDAGRDRMVVMGGEVRGGLDEYAYADAWIFESQYGAGVGDDVRVKRFGLRLAGSNPVRGRAAFDLVVPEASDVAVTVHDVLGGRVAELAHGRFAPGHHPLVWSGDDASGRRASPGIYFVRAAMGGAAATVRLAVVH